jgi:flagellin
MGLQINTNVTAIDALRNLDNVSNQVSSSIEKLSSGLRINTAADDPAGLVISNALQAQISGLNQAVSNSQDATNLIQTAEGGLSSISSLLNNIRTLAVHAANTGVNDATATQADQAQISSAIGSVQRIAEQTQFGDKNLLDGSSGISASVVDTTDVAGINIGGTYGGVATQNGTVNITVNNAASRAYVGGGANATYASVNASLSTVNGGSTGSGGSIVINGQTITAGGSDSVQSLVNAINNLSGTTGVAADFTFANASGSIELTQQSYGSNFQINESESNTLLAGTAGTLTAGLNATVTVTASGLVNGVVTAVISTFVGGQGVGTSGLQVSDNEGNSILLTEAGNGLSSATQTTIGTITAGAVQFQIGANAGQTVSVSLGNVTAANLGNTTLAGQNLSTINVTTAQGATNAINIADQAISQVSTLSANLGAFQDYTLGSAINYLGISSENLSASESQIQDTDVAAEVTNLTKEQIIQQAATSVLAQANSDPQGVLRLLQ